MNHHKEGDNEIRLSIHDSVREVYYFTTGDGLDRLVVHWSKTVEWSEKRGTDVLSGDHLEAHYKVEHTRSAYTSNTGTVHLEQFLKLAIITLY